MSNSVSGGHATIRASRMSLGMESRLADLQGTVHGVYRAAIYLDTGPGEDLIVLALEDVGGLPGGIGLAGETDLRAIGLAVGDRIEGTAERLVAGSARVAIDLGGAVEWSPQLAFQARCAPGPRLAESVSAARRLASRGAAGHGLGPLLRSAHQGEGPAAVPFRAVATRRLAELTEALATDDAARALEAANALVGLGVGLTPSGDDVLVGLLAGLEATGHPARPGLARGIAEVPSGRTSRVSELFLRSASQGAYAERLQNVLVCVAGRAAGLATALEWLMACGSSSGADTLVGLLLALELGAARSDEAVA